MGNNDWVKLTAYSVPYMAELLLSALEANGIKAKVFNAHASSIMPHLSQIIPTDVMVQKNDLDLAQKLLREFELSPLLREDDE